MNIISQNFSLSTNLDYLGIQLPPGTAPSPESAKREILNFLSRHDLASAALGGSQKKTTFVRINRGSLEKVESVSQAQLTRVDFFKIINIDNQNYKVLGPHPREGLTQSLVAGAPRSPDNRIPFINYQNWEIKTDEGSTYPLLTSTEAWKKLEEGKAAVVHLKPQKAGPYQNPALPKVEKVRIQEISLAYFESPSPQKYLLPIFVFEGLAEVRGEAPWEVIVYLPAVREEWLEAKPEEE